MASPESSSSSYDIHSDPNAKLLDFVKAGYSAEWVIKNRPDILPSTQQVEQAVHEMKIKLDRKGLERDRARNRAWNSGDQNPTVGARSRGFYESVPPPPPVVRGLKIVSSEVVTAPTPISSSRRVRRAA